MTKDECIALLKKNPTLSRDKMHIEVPELGRRWQKYFGTWQEFRKAAGLDLSRHQTQVRNQIATHASLDAYRALNEDKRNYGAVFKKPNGKRFKSALLIMDVHDKHCDPFWRKLVVATVKRAQPDMICINGDLFDFPEFGKYSVNPLEWDVVGRIKWVHKFLEDLREAAPDAEIHLNEGNHEYRLLRHLAESTPALRCILSDLHGMTIPQLLGLDKYEVNYNAPADLATLTATDMKAELRRNWLNIYGCMIAHHFPEGATFGMPGVNGHHHNHEVHTFYSPTYDMCEWHQFGCGHKRQASYTNGELWSNGFGMATMDTEKKRTQIEYWDTTHDHCVIAGVHYHRDQV